MAESPTQSGEGFVANRIMRWWSRAKISAARGIQHGFPSLAATVLAMQAQGLRSPEIPALFSRELREIDPGLNDDLLELYGRSHQALASRFAYFNRLHSFEHGVEWEPQESSAWREELHAFDYALDLGMTYRISREEPYARHLRYLISDWIAANPPARGTGWQPAVLARRLHNWMLAADLARAEWEGDPVFRGILSESLALQTTFLLRHDASLLRGAERLEGARALLLASRFFAEGRGSESRTRGRDLVEQELAACTQPDGSLVEPWPRLQLHLVTTLLEWWLLDVSPDWREALRPALRSAAAALEARLLPTGLLPLSGPPLRHGEEELSDAAALLASEFQEPAWKAIADKFGILPYMLTGEGGQERFRRLPEEPWFAGHTYQPRARLFRISGANRSALVISAHASSLPGSHYHLLSYELVLEGQRVIVDSGGHLAQEDEYFPSPIAHNLLLVDDEPPLGTSPEFNLLPQDPWESRPDLVRLTLAGPGYEFQSARHHRTWFCVEGKWWGVVDFLQSTRSPSVLRRPRIISLLHFYPTFEIKVAGRKAVARTRALSVTLLPLGAPDATFTGTRGDHPEFPGWYAPHPGVKYPASVLALESSQGELPWVGGILLMPGDYQGECVSEFNPATGELRLSLDGKHFSLHVG